MPKEVNLLQIGNICRISIACMPACHYYADISIYTIYTVIE